MVSFAMVRGEGAIVCHRTPAAVGDILSFATGYTAAQPDAVRERPAADPATWHIHTLQFRTNPPRLLFVHRQITRRTEESAAAAARHSDNFLAARPPDVSRFPVRRRPDHPCALFTGSFISTKPRPPP